MDCGFRYTSTNFYHKLVCLLHDPRVTALGEVGLDFEGSSSRERGLQVSTLQWVFQHVKEEIPLVLHLRGTRIDPLSEEVGAECLFIYCMLREPFGHNLKGGGDFNVINGGQIYIRATLLVRGSKVFPYYGAHSDMGSS